MPTTRISDKQFFSGISFTIFFPSSLCIFYLLVEFLALPADLLRLCEDWLEDLFVRKASAWDCEVFSHK